MTGAGETCDADVGSRPSWREIVGEASRVLRDRREARWIVQHASGLALAELVRHLDDPAPEHVWHLVRALVDRRRSGEPLQWVLGEWGFRELEVAVDGRALVPRPETELVVEHALRQLATGGPPYEVVDLGTGSGVIALSIASEFPEAMVTATDRSSRALSLARENLARQPPAVRGRVHFEAGDWFEALPSHLAGTVSVVVSNPPYLAAAEWPALDTVVRDYDPYEALVAGATGFEAVSLLISESPRWLRHGGALVVEIAPTQREPALGAVAACVDYAAAEVLDDLADRPRVLVAWRV
jgi:release factor glutamine methyltransferase